MAIQRQIVPIPFVQGLDTKIDPKSQNIGSLIVAENIIYTKLKELRKRNGYTEVSNECIDGTSIDSPLVLAKFDTELLSFNETSLYSFAESLQKWDYKGKANSIFVEATQILRNNNEQTQLDALIVDGIGIYTWLDSSGDVRYSVLDHASNTFLVSNALLASSSISPRIAQIQNNIFIFYITSTDLNYKKFDLLNPSELGSEVTAQSDLDGTNPRIDAASVNNKIVVAYNSDDATDKLTVFTIDAEETLSSSVNFSGEDASVNISIYIDPLTRIFITYTDGATVNYVVLPLSLTSPLVSPTLIETIADIGNTTAIINSDNTYTVYYEITDSDASNYRLKSAIVDLVPSAISPAEFVRSVGLAGKAFRYEENNYILTIHESPLQATNFLLDSDGSVVARINPQVAGTVIDHGLLPQVSNLADDEFVIATQIKGKNVAENNTFFSLLGVNSSIIDFMIDTQYQNAELGDNLHVSGGLLQLYDGNQIVEHGYMVFPETLVSSGTSTMGGSMSDGQYQYVAVYSWVDNKGQEHKSAPSIPLSVTVNGGGSTQTVDIDVPTLRLTDKTDVIIELYRTEDAGTIFYKVTSTSAPTLNDKTVDIVTIEDTLDDTSLIARELLYTTGGVLDNIAAPASKFIASWQNRIVLAGLEDGNEINYSKIRTEGKPVEFNDTLTNRIPNTGGPITAVAVMDEKLIFFKEGAIFYLAGGGPNNLGEQDTFIDPEQIATDVGCISQNSVVLTPFGLFFKSRKGIYVLTPSLQTQYVGQQVEEFNDLTITSAEVKTDLNHVIFTTSDGQALVFNYFLQFWSTYTNHRGISSQVLGSDYYYIRPTYEIYKEDRTSFSDNGSVIKLRLETSWLSFAGLQGFQRIYKMLILGAYKSTHQLLIKVAYNFIEAFTQQKLIDTADFTDDQRYGDDSPYGDDTAINADEPTLPQVQPYGGEGNQYQARLDFKRQKCESIKISIEDVQSVPGEGLSLSALTLDVGGKQGVYKINQRQVYGTE